MGKSPEARERLQQAMTLMEQNKAATNNPAAVAETAAHLGEVLWTTGKHTEAKQVWDKALQQFPKDEKLRAVVKRLNR